MGFRWFSPWGKPWENHGKTMGKYRVSWENHGYMPQKNRVSMGKHKD